MLSRVPLEDGPADVLEELSTALDVYKVYPANVPGLRVWDTLRCLDPKACVLRPKRAASVTFADIKLATICNGVYMSVTFLGVQYSPCLLLNARQNAEDGQTLL